MDRRTALVALAGLAATPIAVRAEALPTPKPNVEGAPASAETEAPATAGEDAIAALMRAQQFRTRVIARGAFASEASRIMTERARNFEVRASRSWNSTSRPRSPPRSPAAPRWRPPPLPLTRRS